MSFQPPHPDGPNNGSEDRNRRILKIDLPDDQLEGTLFLITDLWLRGAYFKWGSKAYHGLVSLRLDRAVSCSISEIELMNILESSPRLRFVDIDMSITRTVSSLGLRPMHLPDLELLVGDAALLRLIRSGSNELTVTIIGAGPEVLSNASVKDFFSCANLVTFYSRTSLRNISEVCHLLSIAPHLRGLAISHTTLTGTLPDMTPPPGALDTLYLLNECVLERSLLETMVDRWRIRRVLFRRASFHLRDDERIPYYTLEGELSSLSERGIQLEFAPEAGSWGHPMELFLGPPYLGLSS
ncbi:hypothetical protein FRC11_014573 [Ceratobasidium sp. 423]|nr:hypothetical protein FRC11_014573 [Ceratobasidium sp. 423]